MGSSKPPPEALDPLVVRARERVGTTLRGKWRLVSLLGIGGMASVFEATHRNGSRAAVKILHTELSSDKLVRERFLREGYAANLVGHEGAVKVLDDDSTDDGALFLVTELLEGDTLEELAHRAGGRLRWAELRPMADQLLEVLSIAHEKGIVHRDIKPDNIFVTRAGRVKVLDFGIARLRETASTGTTTQAGTTMGSPAFMSPEQARGLWDEVDHRTDLWAVGATMYTVLSGRLVHDGRTANELLLSAMTQPAPLLSSVSADTPEAVAKIVDRALAFSKTDRWNDAHAMRQALQGVIGAPFEALRTVIRVPTPSVPVPAVEAATHPTFLAVETSEMARADEGLPGRRRGGLIAVGVAAALAGLIAVLALARPSWRSSEPKMLADDPSAARVVTTTTVVPSSTPEPATPLAPLPDSVTQSATTSPPAAPVPASAPAAAPTHADRVATNRPASPAIGAPSPSSSPAAQSGGGGKGAACNPPYVVDSTTGAKKWKLECL